MRDVNRLSCGFLVALIGFFISSRVVSAEMPPSAYAKMQDAAGEVLQVIVLSVDGSFQWRTDNESHLIVTARVVCTVRSASGLTPGATITINYSTVLKRSWGWAGPAPIGILQLKPYTAYLDKSDAIYTPAAQGQSFIADEPGAQPSPVSKRC